MEPSEVATGVYSIMGTMADFNGNGPADLGDAIIALKILCGLDVSVALDALKADVNGDNKISFAEVFYILQEISRLKE
jgi:hypothetical protein